MEWLVDNGYKVIGGIVITLIPLAIYLGIQEQKQWDAFAASHQCKLIAHQNGYTMYGYHNGKYGSYWVPSKNTYRCNDGVDYTR